MLLRRALRDWKDALTFVKPDTVSSLSAASSVSASSISTTAGFSLAPADTSESALRLQPLPRLAAFLLLA
jgi:hypothetical protein